MRCFIAIMSTVVLGACVNSLETDPREVPVVPIDRVINSLKCGFARVLDSDKLGRSGIRGAIGNAKLSANMTYGIDSSGKFSAGLPVTAGVTLTPTFSFQATDEKKYNTTVEFDIDLGKYDLGICGNEYSVDYDAGFTIWLAQVISSISEAAAGAPYARMRKYEYSAEFIVKRTVSGGVDAKIVIVNTSASASASSTTTDIHKLTVTIDTTGKKDGPKGNETQRPEGPNWFKKKLDPQSIQQILRNWQRQRN